MLIQIKKYLKMFFIIVLIGNSGLIYAYTKPESNITKHKCCWTVVTNSSSGSKIRLYGTDGTVSSPISCPKGSILRIYYASFRGVVVHGGGEYSNNAMPYYAKCYKTTQTCSWYPAGNDCPSEPPS